ncbi:GntR family transcriptional regulator [soil metagenome]
MVANTAGPSRIGDIAERLSNEIAAGGYPVGERFPTEAVLQVRFGVGRHTVREALKVLAERGLVGRRRKTGTFVISESPVTPYVHSLRDLRGLLDFAHNTQLKITHMGMISVPPGAMPNLWDLPDKRWLRVAGLRTVREDGMPLCWSEIYVPERFTPARTDLQASPDGIYERTMEHNGFRLEYVEQEVTATLLAPALMDLLKTDGEPAGLMVKRRYVSHTGETFEVSQNLYPARRYTIRSVIRQRA